MRITAVEKLTLKKSEVTLKYNEPWNFDETIHEEGPWIPMRVEPRRNSRVKD